MPTTAPRDQARGAPVPGVKYPSDPPPRQAPPCLHQRGRTIVSGIFHYPAPADSCVTQRGSTTLSGTPAAPFAVLAGRAAPEAPLRRRQRLQRRHASPCSHPSAPWMFGIPRRTAGAALLGMTAVLRLGGSFGITTSFGLQAGDRLLQRRLVTRRANRSTTLPGTPTAPFAALAGRAAPESPLRPRQRLHRRHDRRCSLPGAPWVFGIPPRSLCSLTGQAVAAAAAAARSG